MGSSKWSFNLATSNDDVLWICKSYAHNAFFKNCISLFLKEQRRQQLYTKLGREQIFDSLIERDQWIREEQR